MYKVKFLALVAVAILLSGLFVVGAAQKRLPPQPPQPVEPPSPAVSLSGSYNTDVSANELSVGETDATSGTTYGWTSYGTTQGDLSGYMFMSLNYSSPRETTADGNGSAIVSSGSWSKLIFVDGQYVGSVFGSIVGGEITWNGDLTANINLQLTSDNGTEAYVGLQGSGTFEGKLDQSLKASTVTGRLTLNY